MKKKKAPTQQHFDLRASCTPQRFPISPSPQENTPFAAFSVPQSNTHVTGVASLREPLTTTPPPLPGCRPRVRRRRTHRAAQTNPNPSSTCPPSTTTLPHTQLARMNMFVKGEKNEHVFPISLIYIFHHRSRNLATKEQTKRKIQERTFFHLKKAKSKVRGGKWGARLLQARPSITQRKAHPAAAAAPLPAPPPPPTAVQPESVDQPLLLHPKNQSQSVGKHLHFFVFRNGRPPPSKPPPRIQPSSDAKRKRNRR